MMTGYYMTCVAVVFFLLSIVFGTIAWDYLDAALRYKRSYYRGMYFFLITGLLSLCFSVWILYCAVMYFVIPSISPEVRP